MNKLIPIREQGIYTYGDLIIKDGQIIGNPFSYNVNNSQASLWIINNREKVISMISRYISALRVHGGDAEDCYNYAIYYFLDRRDREVVLNFFGDESGYNVEKYCMSNLKFVVYNYKTHVQKMRGAHTINLVDNEEMENYQTYGTNMNQLTNKQSLSSSNDYADPYHFEGNDQMAKDFYNEIMMYTDYFEKQGYAVFDVMNFLSYLFFHSHEIIDETEQAENKEHFRRILVGFVASKLNMSEDLARLVYDDFIQGVRKQDELASDLFEVINRYVDLGLKGQHYNTSLEKPDSWDNIENYYV